MIETNLKVSSSYNSNRFLERVEPAGGGVTESDSIDAGTSDQLAQDAAWSMTLCDGLGQSLITARLQRIGIPSGCLQRQVRCTISCNYCAVLLFC